MAAVLDHMSIPARDKVATAEFYARVFGVTFTLNFETSDVPEAHHYAFMVPGDEFDAIRGRLDGDEVPYGNTTRDSNNEIYDHDGRKGFYFADPNGHGLEIMTPSASS
jgi:catechol 2,3-dioxygenase-like lactoylglutathione lyase family enzyme